MQDILSLLSSLRRPRLLIRAARIGADDYRREHRTTAGGAVERLRPGLRPSQARGLPPPLRTFLECFIEPL